MSWIGLTDLTKGLFNPAGLGAKSSSTNEGVTAPFAILPTGTMVIETLYRAEPDQPQTVLRYDRKKDWYRHLSVDLTAAGEMQVHMVQGQSRFVARLAFPAPERDTLIRLYFSWNGPERAGRLALKMIETGQFHVVNVGNPLPMPMLDALTIMRNGHSTRIGPETAFVAVSDTVEPVGLSAGFCQGTAVETPSGPIKIENLRLGDKVLTATSGVQPVRWITKRTVPALGQFRPIRIRAPFFGLSEDMLMAPDHRILVEGSETEYLLGETDALLQAQRLVGSHAALSEARLKTVTYYHVLLDHHDCLLHGGLRSESLYVGQIAMDRDRLAATALAEMPVSAIPKHRGFARHRLTDTEARSLASVLHR
ncbi:MAG: Hint domain-containing protein [Pseudomonadota bacterium]|nr:Hint domain-containing protein [Pseudomonadota bacterium]